MTTTKGKTSVMKTTLLLMMASSIACVDHLHKEDVTRSNSGILVAIHRCLKRGELKISLLRIGCIEYA